MTGTEDTTAAGAVVNPDATPARPGQELPPLTVDVTATTLAKCVAGTRDLYPIHHDRGFARDAGVRDIFLNTMWYQGLLGRFATDWGGPDSFVTRLSFAMRAINCPGDTLTVRGRVREVTGTGSTTSVRLDISIDNQSQRDTVAADLTLEMPA